MYKYTRIKSFFTTEKHFGFQVAFWTVLYPNRILKRYTDLGILIKHRIIKKYLVKKYSNIINTYKFKNEESPLPMDYIAPIWICWWDGKDKMPDIVKICFNSVCKNSGTHPVILITKFNYQNYATIPKFIFDKVDAGKISITHLSDILRMCLLYEHGGIWMDSTIYMTGKLPVIMQDGLFTIKHKIEGCYVSECKWTGFFIGGIKGNELFKFMRTIFFEYWEKEEQIIDYFLIDYFISIAYESIQSIKQMIDNIPYNNIQLYDIQNNLNNSFKNSLFKSICSETYFHKLTWKGELQENTDDGNVTFYGYLIKELQ